MTMRRFVEDAPRNRFSRNAFVGSFVHVVGASDENCLLENRLSGEGARIDLEAGAARTPP